MLLNIMGGMVPDARGPITPERMHLEIEAGRLAYRDRGLVLADPVQASVPVHDMLDQAYADSLRGQITPNRRLDPLPPSQLPRHSSTVYITVVDRDRNACSFIN